MENTETQESPLPAEVVRPQDYGASRPLFFPSPTSLTWYVRKHRARLVELGALVVHRGSWYARPRAFDEAVFVISGEEALRKVMSGRR